MPLDWTALPGLPKPFGSAVAPEHFGDLAAELGAIADPAQTALIVTDMAWIRVSGEDARSFLHNQLTSDVNHLAPGNWQRSAWCSAKGRMLASLVLARPNDGQEYELGLPVELLPVVLKRLRMFVLRSKVVFEDLSDTVATFAIKGPGLAALATEAGMGGLPAAGTVASTPAGRVIRVSGSECLVAAMPDQISRFAGWAGKARLAGLAAWRLAGIRSGVPVVLAATQDEFVPQMVNFDKLGGISFHKGCYPGQEVVARTQYLGKVKRHLYRARSSQEVKPGTPLFQDGGSQETSGACGTVANSAPSPAGGWESLVVVLESAAPSSIRAGSPNGPELSNLDLVAA